MSKFLKYLIIFLIVSINYTYAFDKEELETYTDAITEAQESFSKLSEAKSEEGKILDEAINKINEATSYVEKNLDVNNNKEAIKALEYVEKSLTDIENFIPPEFSSDMSKIDTSIFTKDEMDLITEITNEMKSNKEEKLVDLVNNMVDLNENGLSTLDISKNLNELGIKTVNLSIELDKRKEMESWSKEQWADSYKGSILTSTGEEVITDKEIKGKVTELENKLISNNQKILEKATSLDELKSKIDPLNSEITNLKSQKDNLTIQYNQELLKQSNLLAVNDMTESKKITDNLNKEIENLSKNLSQKEQNVLNFNNQVKELDLELNANITLTTNLTSQINTLNSNLLESKSLISKKEVQLEQFKKTRSNLDKEIKTLNDEIKSASVERDFIETKFEKSIDKEVEAFKHYATALSDYELGTPEYIRDAQFSLREVSVITDNDPKAQRIFDLQKYGLEAGLSKEYIDKGIQSIKNDDWDAQKNIYRDLIDGMAKNPNWTVDKLSEAELNVAILEDKAVQEAVQIANEGAATRLQVNQIINEKISPYQAMASLNPNKLSGFASVNTLGSYVPAYYVEEHLAFKNELNNLVKSNSDINSYNKEINELKNQIDGLNLKNSEITGKMMNEYNFINGAVKSSKEHIEFWENTVGPNGNIDRKNQIFLDRAGIINPNDWEEVSPKLSNLRQEQGWNSGYGKEIQAFADYQFSKTVALNNFTKQVEDFNKKNPQILARDLNNQILSKEQQIKAIENSLHDDAKESLLKSYEEAKTNIEKITEAEIAKAPNYNYKERIDVIIDDVPTWGGEEKNRVAEAISGHSFGSYKGVTDLNRGAAVRAALSGKEDFNAFTEVAKELAEMDEKTSFPGNPYFERSNIRAAAVLRSKKYDWVDNYQYSKGIYNPVELTTEERSKVEGALKGILAEDNPKLNVLNQKITNLNNQVKSNTQNLTSLPNDISKIETELNSLKSNEKTLENQVKDLQKQFTSNEINIANKREELKDLQDKLSPITNEITELQNQKNELSNKLNEQVSILNDKLISSDKAKVDALNLKTQFENQLTNLNTQVDQYQKESVEINSQLSVLNNELEELKVETPEIANQIDNLNKDIANFIDVKADLALAEAKKNNINIEEKVIDKVKTMENKSIITINGTETFRVVDNNALMDNKGNFNVPTGTLTVKGNVYTAGAVQPEKLFSFSKLNTEVEINSKLSNLEKDYELGKITEEQFKNERNSINALRNNASVEFSQLASAQLSTTGTLKGGEQKFTGNTLGSWVLVNATTGEQMKNPLTGHKGGIVGTADVLGPNGAFGQQATSFGGMYVLEGLAGQTGNVASRCGGGGCKFDVDTMRVLGPNNIENNIFNERGEGLFQSAFTSAELNEIEKDGMTTLQRQHAIEHAVKNNINFDASALVSEESLSTQAAGLAYAAKNNINVTEINKVAGSYSKFKTDNFKEAVKSTVTYSGKDFSLNNATASTASDAASSATSAASSVASEVSQTASAAASSAAQQAATAAAAAAQEISQEVAQAAQEAAAEATAAASSVITGNDVAALSQLANDALGAWVLVDAATGKQMTNPVTGYSGSSVCTASHCGAAGAGGKAAAEFGGVYVLERLADPDTGNVAGSCAGGDCQFDLGND